MFGGSGARNEEPAKRCGGIHHEPGHGRHHEPVLAPYRIDLRYWRLQGTLQKTYWKEEVFIPWRVFLSQTCK
jgi:hypothetical protein